MTPGDKVLVLYTDATNRTTWLEGTLNRIEPSGDCWVDLPLGIRVRTEATKVTLNGE